MAKIEKKKAGGSQAEGTRRSYFVFDPSEVIIIGLDTKDGPEHPLYDGASNAYAAERDADKIANVRTFGVLKPILFERDGDRVLVIAGRKRVRWARCAAAQQKAAGEEILVVPGIPKRGDGVLMFGLSRAENMRGPEDSPLEHARNAQKALDMNGGSERAAAIYFGVSVQQLKQWLLLLELAPQVQRAVERGLAVSAAVPLAKLPKAEQVAKLAQLTDGAGKQPTARAVTNKLRSDAGKPAIETPGQKLARIDKLLEVAIRSPSFIECRATLDEIMAILHPGQSNGTERAVESTVDQSQLTVAG